MKQNFRPHRSLLGAPGGSPLNTISLTDISTHSKQVWSIAVTTRLLYCCHHKTTPFCFSLSSFLYTSIPAKRHSENTGRRDPNTDYLNTEKYLRVHFIGTFGYAYLILHKEESHFSRYGLRKASGNSGIVHHSMTTLFLQKNVKQKTVK